MSSTKKHKILITGGAGFIGFHVAKRLLQEHKYDLVLVDNLNNYYSPTLKQARLTQLEKYGNNFSFEKIDISKVYSVRDLFKRHKFKKVINLAAQAGVRHAARDPESYIKSNITGFFNVINCAVENGVETFLYASSSSVYGSNNNTPWQESEPCDKPLSLYAATKCSNEAIAHSYAQNFNIETIGLRLFNVYGPWGRPDMAYFKWADQISAKKVIEVRNNGEMLRDMTYIDDVVECVTRLIELPKNTTVDNSTLYNIGNGNPVKIKEVLSFIAQALNQKPQIKNVPKGTEEPVITYADTKKLQETIGYEPHTTYDSGLSLFLEWYQKSWAEGEYRNTEKGPKLV